MTDITKTHVAALVDRSGSMQSIKDDTVGGFNAFIAKQRQQPGASTVSLYQFDTHYDIVYTGLPIADVPPLVLKPRGGTALLDAVGRTITDTRQHLAGLPEDQRPGTVIVVIMTDGEENSSREFTYPVIKKMIETQETVEGWTFMYFGADQDAIEIGTRMGVSAGQSLSYSRSKTAEVWHLAAESIGVKKAARMAGHTAAEASRLSAFTDEQRRNTVD